MNINTQVEGCPHVTDFSEMANICPGVAMPTHATPWLRACMLHVRKQLYCLFHYQEKKQQEIVKKKRKKKDVAS